MVNKALFNLRFVHQREEEGILHLESNIGTALSRPTERPIATDHGAVKKRTRRVSVVSKRLLDLGIALLALGLLSPLIAFISVAICLFDGAPILIGHERLGRRGEPFRCLKFRTMVSDADRVLRNYLAENEPARAEWSAGQKLVNDPRITKLGHFLRVTSLDELPQLMNVLRGEMSLVGPRPIVRGEAERYGSQFEHCFSVLPGITGLWQINGRNACSYPQRVALDVAYATEQSFSLDLRILIKTVPAVLMQRGSL